MSEFTEKQENILQRAIEKFGALPQLDMFNEEAGECLKALNKVKRKGGVITHSIVVPNKTSPLDYCIAYYDLCSEIADLEIIVHQMKKMLGQPGNDAIKLAKERKIERLENRLNKNTY